MSARSSRERVQAVAKRLHAAKSLLLVTHANPDGDGLGSMAALALAAGSSGRSVALCVPDAVPPRYAFLFEGLKPAGSGQFANLADQADAIVILDTCALEQLNDLANELQERRDKIVVVDHHATHEDVGSLQWIDTSAAAVGVMIGELLDALGWPMEQRAAEALVVAATTDTGWLRFSNTDGRCLRLVARCIDAGVRADELYRRIYEADRVERLRLAARMLASLELHRGGKLAVMTIRAQDFAETKARPDETENLVNEAMRVASVELAVLLVEREDVIRASLRSRSEIDVSRIAERFGGGGHARAAGCRDRGDFERFKSRLVRACREALQGK